MKKTICFLTIITFFFAEITLAQNKNKVYQYDQGSSPREHNVDFERMRLEVEFEPEKGLVLGKITHFFSPLREKIDSIFLDGPGIVVKDAKLNGQVVKYKTYDNGI